MGPPATRKQSSASNVIDIDELLMNTILQPDAMGFGPGNARDSAQPAGREKRGSDVGQSDMKPAPGGPSSVGAGGSLSGPPEASRSSLGSETIAGDPPAPGEAPLAGTGLHPAPPPLGDASQPLVAEVSPDVNMAFTVAGQHVQSVRMPLYVPGSMIGVPTPSPGGPDPRILPPRVFPIPEQFAAMGAAAGGRYSLYPPAPASYGYGYSGTYAPAMQLASRSVDLECQSSMSLPGSAPPVSSNSSAFPCSQEVPSNAAAVDARGSSPDGVKQSDTSNCGLPAHLGALDESQYPHMSLLTWGPEGPEAVEDNILAPVLPNVPRTAFVDLAQARIAASPYVAEAPSRVESRPGGPGGPGELGAQKSSADALPGAGGSSSPIVLAFKILKTLRPRISLGPSASARARSLLAGPPAYDAALVFGMTDSVSERRILDRSASLDQGPQDGGVSHVSCFSTAGFVCQGSRPAFYRKEARAGPGDYVFYVVSRNSYSVYCEDAAVLHYSGDVVHMRPFVTVVNAAVAMVPPSALLPFIGRGSRAQLFSVVSTPSVPAGFLPGSGDALLGIPEPPDLPGVPGASRLHGKAKRTAAGRHERSRSSRLRGKSSKGEASKHRGYASQGASSRRSQSPSSAVSSPSLSASLEGASDGSEALWLSGESGESVASGSFTTADSSDLSESLEARGFSAGSEPPKSPKPSSGRKAKPQDDAALEQKSGDAVEAGALPREPAKASSAGLLTSGTPQKSKSPREAESARARGESEARRAARAHSSLAGGKRSHPVSDPSSDLGAGAEEAVESDRPGGAADDKAAAANSKDRPNSARVPDALPSGGEGGEGSPALEGPANPSAGPFRPEDASSSALSLLDAPRALASYAMTAHPALAASARLCRIFSSSGLAVMALLRAAQQDGKFPGLLADYPPRPLSSYSLSASGNVPDDGDDYFPTFLAPSEAAAVLARGEALAERGALFWIPSDGVLCDYLAELSSAAWEKYRALRIARVPPQRQVDVLRTGALLPGSIQPVPFSPLVFSPPPGASPAVSDWISWRRNCMAFYGSTVNTFRLIHPESYGGTVSTPLVTMLDPAFIHAAGKAEGDAAIPSRKVVFLEFPQPVALQLVADLPLAQVEDGCAVSAELHAAGVPGLEGCEWANVLQRCLAANGFYSAQKSLYEEKGLSRSGSPKPDAPASAQPSPHPGARQGVRKGAQADSLPSYAQTLRDLPRTAHKTFHSALRAVIAALRAKYPENVVTRALDALQQILECELNRPNGSVQLSVAVTYLQMAAMVEKTSFFTPELDGPAPPAPPGSASGNDSRIPFPDSAARLALREALDLLLISVYNGIPFWDLFTPFSAPLTGRKFQVEIWRSGEGSPEIELADEPPAPEEPAKSSATPQAERKLSKKKAKLQRRTEGQVRRREQQKMISDATPAVPPGTYLLRVYVDSICEASFSCSLDALTKLSLMVAFDNPWAKEADLFYRGLPETKVLRRESDLKQACAHSALPHGASNLACAEFGGFTSVYRRVVDSSNCGPDPLYKLRFSAERGTRAGGLADFLPDAPAEDLSQYTVLDLAQGITNVPAACVIPVCTTTNLPSDLLSYRRISLNQAYDEETVPRFPQDTSSRPLHFEGLPFSASKEIQVMPHGVSRSLVIQNRGPTVLSVSCDRMYRYDYSAGSAENCERENMWARYIAQYLGHSPVLYAGYHYLDFEAGYPGRNPPPAPSKKPANAHDIDLFKPMSALELMEHDHQFRQVRGDYKRLMESYVRHCYGYILAYGIPKDDETVQTTYRDVCAKKDKPTTIGLRSMRENLVSIFKASLGDQAGQDAIVRLLLAILSSYSNSCLLLDWGKSNNTVFHLLENTDVGAAKFVSPFSKEDCSNLFVPLGERGFGVSGADAGVGAGGVGGVSGVSAGSGSNAPAGAGASADAASALASLARAVESVERTSILMRRCYMNVVYPTYTYRSFHNLSSVRYTATNRLFDAVSWHQHFSVYPELMKAYSFYDLRGRVIYPSALPENATALPFEGIYTIRSPRPRPQVFRERGAGQASQGVQSAQGAQNVQSVQNALGASTASAASAALAASNDEPNLAGEDYDGFGPSETRVVQSLQHEALPLLTKLARDNVSRPYFVYENAIVYAGLTVVDARASNSCVLVTSSFPVTPTHGSVYKIMYKLTGGMAWVIMEQCSTNIKVGAFRRPREGLLPQVLTMHDGAVLTVVVDLRLMHFFVYLNHDKNARFRRTHGVGMGYYEERLVMSGSLGDSQDESAGQEVGREKPADALGAVHSGGSASAEGCPVPLADVPLASPGPYFNGGKPLFSDDGYETDDEIRAHGRRVANPSCRQHPRRLYGPTRLVFEVSRGVLEVIH